MSLRAWKAESASLEGRQKPEENPGKHRHSHNHLRNKKHPFAQLHLDGNGTAHQAPLPLSRDASHC